jgi:hypothetical protein
MSASAISAQPLEKVKYGKNWAADARPSEDRTPEAGVFGAKTHLVNVVPAL